MAGALDPEEQDRHELAFRDDTATLAASMRGKPGRPRQGARKLPLSLKELDRESRQELEERRERRESKGERKPTITRSSIDNWVTGKTVPTPEKYTAFLSKAGVKGAQAVRHVAKYAPLYIQQQASRVVKATTPLLKAQPGESIHFHLETTVHMTADVVTVEPVENDLTKWQLEMRSSASFGWITDGRTLKITAPSKPVCELLGIPFADLDGSYLIGDPLVGKLQEMLDNFGEWLLTLSLLVGGIIAQWREEDQPGEWWAGLQFFDLVRRYVKENYDSVNRQIARARSRAIDDESRRLCEALDHCLLAAVKHTPWPSYAPEDAVWNPMRLYIGKHELLPQAPTAASKQIARFTKAARPIPGGFEVIWDAEYGDALASKLIRDVLLKLGYTQV